MSILRNLFCFIILNGLLLSTVISSNLYWSPSALSSLKADYNSEPELKLYDPENLLKLKPDQITEMTSLVKNIKKERNFDTFIYVFSYMDKYYGKDENKDIDGFTNELSYQILQKDEQKDDLALIIVMAIGDRQSRIRTGKLVRQWLSDGKALEYLKNIIPELKGKDYSSAMVNLLNEVHDRLMTYYQFLTDVKDAIIVLLFQSWIGIFIIVYLFALVFGKRNKISETSEEKLKKIKKISENNKPRKEILETVCIICLDELVEEKKENPVKNIHTNCDVGLNSNPGSDLNAEANIETNLESNIDDETLINSPDSVDSVGSPDSPVDFPDSGTPDQKKEENVNFIATLECGHRFHSQCISTWMTKQNKCPVCRDKIDKEDEEENSKPGSDGVNNNSSRVRQNTFARSLVNMQTDLHPDLLLLNFNYHSNDFSWSYPQPRPTSSSSSSCGSWGSSSGGASIKW